MEVININLGQSINFMKDEHFSSFTKDYPKDTVMGALVKFYSDKYPEKSKALLEKPMDSNRYKTTKEPKETPTEKVLGRMYNWKQESALRYAKEIKDFPEEALNKLKHLSEKFGNCGWQDGSIYDELRDTNFEVAKILGYEHDEERDCYLPIKL